MAICIRYLLLHEINNVGLFSEECLALEELPQDSNLFNDNGVPNDYDPYCSWEAWEQNMIHHDPTERGFGELFVYFSYLSSITLAIGPPSKGLDPVRRRHVKHVGQRGAVLRS